MTIELDKIVSKYRDKGFVAGLPVFSRTETDEILNYIEGLEEKHKEGAGGHSLNQFFRVNGHVVIPKLAEIARNTTILDIIEALLGPNLLAWSVELFIKEPNSAKTVSWHQDITYWGMGETDDEITAWLALSDVSIEAGCMRFIPGSHQNGELFPHRDDARKDLVLNQVTEDAYFDETTAKDDELAAGEFSLHDVFLVHGSQPNRSGQRRAASLLLTRLKIMPTLRRVTAAEIEDAGSPSELVEDLREQVLVPQPLHPLRAPRPPGAGARRSGRNRRARERCEDLRRATAGLRRCGLAAALQPPVLQLLRTLLALGFRLLAPLAVLRSGASRRSIAVQRASASSARDIDRSQGGG